MGAPQELLGGLNATQQQAVEHDGGPLLLLAGAGSGKTRVLTRRIAYQLATGHVRAHQVLAITFTNKAAREMRERVHDLTGKDGQRLWVMTFHATCARLLRTEGQAIGYTPTFSIYDQADSRRLIKRLLADRDDVDTDDDTTSPRLIQAQISEAKNRMLTPEQWIASHGDTPENHALIELWGLYDHELKRMNALDFDDLLLATIRLLEQHPDVRAKYQRRFQQILVDEYQDTNQAQYRVLQLLLGEHRNLTVVGDPDQGVYSFRAADITNILNFEAEFPDAKVIRLEQNYRSTQIILDAANAVISHNQHRKPKQLWTDQAPGQPIQVHELSDGDHEADHVATLIRQAIAAGHSPADIAVLYRTNAQSRALENALRAAHIAYQIAGGLRFYDRAEIKDALAYLRLIANPHDDDALTRIINTPRRGIGPATVNNLRLDAAYTGQPMLDTARHAVHNPHPSRPYNTSVQKFVDQIDELNTHATLHANTVAPVLEHILTTTGLLPDADSNDTRLLSRRENLLELVQDAATYDRQNSGAGTLTGFLEQTSLTSDADNIEPVDQVTLMTLHASKGLEYPIVFLAGFEEHLFPHDRAIQEGADNIEEERRLCYVGITRAQEQLHLTYTRQRRINGRTNEAHPSRFLLEIPEALYQHHSHDATDQVLAQHFNPQHPARLLNLHTDPPAPAPTPTAEPSHTPTPTPAPSHTPTATAAPAASHPDAAATTGGYQKGQHITHADLGHGTISHINGSILTVTFTRHPGRSIDLHAKRAPIQHAA